MNILILYGGDSPEREVSLKSGENVSEALKKSGHKTFMHDTLQGFEGIAEYKDKVDLVFPILHGLNGEDGKVQKILEELNMKFLGAGSTASEKSFNKIRAHEIIEKNRIKMPRYREVVIADIDDQMFSRPYVLKPIEGGSSIDTQIVRSNSSSEIETSKSLLKKYKKMILEELISGREITVPVLGDKCLSVIAIIPPKNEEFSFENKYNDKSQEICPAPREYISAQKQFEAQEISMKIHKTLEIRDLSRTDLILSEDGELFVLEINTMPGMRKESLYPKAAKEAGITMEDLVNQFVKMVESRK